MLTIGITGSNGFIGKHLLRILKLVLTLMRVRYTIILVDLTPNQNPLSQNVRFVLCDIRNKMDVENALSTCDILFHLAAESNVMRAEADPSFTMSTAKIGTFNILGLLKINPNMFIVATSSREVYGPALYTPVDEGHPIGGTNVYSESKKLMERIIGLCIRLFPQFQDNIAVPRLSNVIGVGDPNFARVIPAWSIRAAKGEPLVIYGGQQVIDFIPVEFVCETLIHLGLNRIATTVNVGSGIGTPIMELATRFQTLSNVSLDIRPARPQETPAYVAEISHLADVAEAFGSDPLANLSDILAYYAELVGQTVAA